jgi:phosphate transport system permease protein
VSSAASTTTLAPGRRLGSRIGDLLLYGITGAAAIGAVALLIAIAIKVIDGSRLAYDKFGLGFVTDQVWDPVKNQFGALAFIYGTAITSFFTLLIATPLAVAIALYLTELAPRGVRDIIGSLVEMLAAVPSVILGLWGILVLGPIVADHIEPFLHRWLGFLPLFQGSPSNSGYLPAVIVLTIMVVPIVASVSRELFLSVPPEMKEGAYALGMTRWEVVRGVILPHAGPGIAAAVILGLGRAIGEAIAVTQVIGNIVQIKTSLFAEGVTLGSQIAAQYQGATSNLQISALIYLGAIMLVFSLIVNVIAQLIVRRFDLQRAGGVQ